MSKGMQSEFWDTENNPSRMEYIEENPPVNNNYNRNNTESYFEKTMITNKNQIIDYNIAELKKRDINLSNHQLGPESPGIGISQLN